MDVFYEVLPIRDALRHGLFWAHVRMLTKLGREDSQQWNKNEANALAHIAVDPLRSQSGALADQLACPCCGCVSFAEGG